MVARSLGVVLLALVSACDGGKPSEDTGETADSGTPDETGDSGETGETGDSGETGESGDSGETAASDEVCNGVDDDGDGLVDEADPDLVDGISVYTDADADGFGDPATAAVVCALGDGQVADATDCDDTRDDVNPNGVETCDNVDQDCSGVVDDNVADAPEWYPDRDGDGYGDTYGETLSACVQPEGYVSDATDCLDIEAECNPSARGSMDCEAIEDCDCDGIVEHRCDPNELPYVVSGAIEGYTGLDLSAELDVTGDGVVDLVTSTPYADLTGDWLGFIEVYDGPLGVGMTPGSGRVLGSRDRGLLGFELDVADLDGDGVGDLVYSGPEEEGGARWSNGAYVTFGPITTESTSDTADWRVTTAESNETVAYALEAAGDIDGDGDEDVAVGFTGYSAGGSVWLLTPTPGEALDISQAEIGVYTNRDSAGVGQSIAAGHDVNGDGQVDLVVGAPGVDSGAGEVRVFWGPITGTDPWGYADVTVAARGSDHDIGAEVDVVDDLDGDGLPELFVPRYEGGCFMGASVAGDYGTTDAPLQVLGPGATDLTMFDYSTGSAVVTDLNLDGVPDLVVGNDGTSVDFEGLLAVVVGPVPTGVVVESANQWWWGGLYEGMGGENRLIGDTNGDGHPEVLTTRSDYYGYGYILLVDGADVR